jgi:hypothetical protein
MMTEPHLIFNGLVSIGQPISRFLSYDPIGLIFSEIIKFPKKEKILVETIFIDA